MSDALRRTLLDAAYTDLAAQFGVTRVQIEEAIYLRWCVLEHDPERIGRIARANDLPPLPIRSPRGGRPRKHA